jgi:hypothetical protein
MTREEISRLLALEPLVSTPELLVTLQEAEAELKAVWEPLDIESYSLLEAIHAIGGNWRRLHDYCAGDLVDLNSNLSFFYNVSEVVSHLVDMASRGRGSRSLYARAAAHMLGLHGLLSLAFETQTIEKEATTITLTRWGVPE